MPHLLSISSLQEHPPFFRRRYLSLPSYFPQPVTASPHATKAGSQYSRGEILHIRNYALYTPRDFDLSPYFRVVKPTIERGFDYKALVWSDQGGENTLNRP